MNQINEAMYPESVTILSERALDWLETAPIATTKEASQAARALCIWGHDTSSPLTWLEQARSGDHWDEDNPVRNTARACTALLECGISCSESLDWLLEVQSGNGSWNNNVYDTCYCLMALDAGGINNQAGVRWLLDNFSKDWEHPGVIALINSALIHQDRESLFDTIGRNSSWLLDQRSDDHWKYTATSCLVVQSLILAGYAEHVGPSVDWLLAMLNGCRENEWKISEVALVLIALKMFTGNSDQVTAMS